MSARLCKSCENILNCWDWAVCQRNDKAWISKLNSSWVAIYDDKLTLQLDQTLSSLQISAANCDLCAIILAQILENHSLPELLERFPCDKFNVRLSSGCGSGHNDLCFTLGSDAYYIGPGPNLRPLTHLSKVSVYPLRIDDAISPTLEISHNTNSDATLALLRDWLSECKRSHELCTLAAETACVLPTRLLDLTPLDHHGADLRLCTECLPPETKYATLSHCWGDAKITKLTSEELPKFSEGILLTDLCQTFKDTIDICRRIGFRYLWIDSLCIIQDSDDDWRRESLRMSDVYGRSSLNIAAAGAVNGSKGCYFDRNPDLLRSAHIPVSSNKLDSPKTIFEAVTDHFTNDVVKGPLASRGWAFQERVLSRRTVHFSKTQIYWDCKELTACELFRTSLPGRYVHWHWSRHAKDNQSLFKEWASLVEAYSTTSLSKGEDKLIAIGGMAKYLQKKHGGFYIAGLWREALVYQMGWYIEDYPLLARPEGNRAPTWSWASVDGKVRFPGDPPDTTGISYLSAIFGDPKVECFGEDQIGAVPLPDLQIKCGPLLVGSSSETTSSFEMSSSSFSHWYPHMDAEPRHVNEATYLMPLFHTPHCVPDSNPLLHGLILKRAGKERGRYSRVGLFYMAAERFFTEQTRKESCAAEVDYQEILTDEREQGGKSYIISIT